MKHLFIIHSNLTYLAALGVICKEQLCLDDVIICSPHFFVDEPIPVVKIKEVSLREAIVKFRWKDYLNACGFIDRQIDLFINGDEFTAYVPSIPYPHSVIITHAKCKTINFIEEGSSNYCTIVSFNRVYRIGRIGRDIGCKSWRIGLWMRFKDACWVFKIGGKHISRIGYDYFQYIYPTTVKFYGFLNETYSAIPQERKVKISFDQVSKTFYRNGYNNLFINTGDVILLGTIFSLDQKQLLNQYFDAVENISCELKTKKTKFNIFYKPHPIERQDSINEILRRISVAGINITILDRRVMIEVLLTQHTGITVIGCGSSLNIYAKSLGHNVIDYSTMIDLSVENRA